MAAALDDERSPSTSITSDLSPMSVLSRGETVALNNLGCGQRCQEYASHTLFGSSSKIPVQPDWGPTRRCLAKLIGNNLFEVFMGLVIGASLVLAMVETDRRVQCEDDQAPECAANSANIAVPTKIILGIYVLELFLRIVVYQTKFLHYSWNIFDAIVVAISIAGEICGDYMQDAFVIRIFRILRLVRILRLFTVFNELYLMLAGIGSTMRTIFWACVMLTVVLAICSLVAVEVLHPVNAQLTAEGFHRDCPRCAVAYSSVSNAMVTFFHILIMGEDVDRFFTPLIERDTLACIVLLSTMAIVYLGFSNLILSVIVEKASEARASDAKYKSMVHGKAKTAIKNELIAIWQGTGEDADSGSLITLQQLKHKYKTCREFRNYFRAMDMDIAFLEYTFKLSDWDNSGDTSFEAFADCVAKMKHTDTGPLVIYIKEIVTQLREDVAVLRSQVKETSSSKQPRTKTPSCWRSAMANPGTEPTKPKAAYMEGAPLRSPRLDPSDDLVSMLKKVFDGPCAQPTLERQFEELSRVIEAQLASIVKRTVEEYGDQSRAELLACSSRLVAGITADLPALVTAECGPRAGGLCGPLCRQSEAQGPVGQQLKVLQNSLAATSKVRSSLASEDSSSSLGTTRAPGSSVGGPPSLAGAPSGHWKVLANSVAATNQFRAALDPGGGGGRAATASVPGLRLDVAPAPGSPAPGRSARGASARGSPGRDSSAPSTPVASPGRFQVLSNTLTAANRYRGAHAAEGSRDPGRAAAARVPGLPLQALREANGDRPLSPLQRHL